MKHIHQKDSSGCGIAAVAMVLNKSYNTIRRKAIKKEIVSDKDLGTSYVDLQKLLAFYGVNGKRKKTATSWKDIPSTSIVGLQKHWVVFVRTKNDFYILDPKDETGKKFRSFAGRTFYQYITLCK